MTNLEAWEIVENYISDHETELGHSDDFLALSLASNALHKQVPEKPTEVCPYCHAVVEGGWNHCHHCGKALDWAGGMIDDTGRI